MKKTWTSVRLNDEYILRPMNAQDKLMVLRGIEIAVSDLDEANKGHIAGTDRAFSIDIRRLKYAMDCAHDHQGDAVYIHNHVEKKTPPTLHELKVQASEYINLWAHALKRSHAQPHG